MFDANDHNLGELSRKAAEEFFDESLIPSWNQLETKLDIELPVKKKFRRVFAFWIFFAGLLGSFLYTGFEGSFSKMADKYSLAVTTAPAKQNAQVNETIVSSNAHSDRKDSLKIKVNQSAQVVYDNDIDYLTSQENSQLFSGQPSTQTSLKFKTTKDSKSVNKESGLQGQKFESETLLAEKKEIENSVSVSPTDAKGTGIKLKKEIALETVITSVENDNTLNKTKISDSLISDKGKINNNSHNTVTEPAKKYINKHGFTIAAIAGTNINSVSFNKSSEAGFDYGFLVGYKLSTKFEIKSGLIFSRKYFTTTGKNISFDSAKLNLPSYSKINLEDATGYCRFVEVPVMLYYSFQAKSNTSFYAGAGFSFNKMRMGKIHYTFLVNSNTLVERTHAGTNYNADGYSTSVTSNITFGLKQKLSEQWSLGFEPYLKIPLTKVNDSDLKLTTFGVSASLIFNFPNKNKK